jgi:glycosyltransferase involved in cell wall biosynthesis
MKIAQIAPDWRPFHAATAIAIKGVVKDLAVGLTARGHEVSVFAPDGSDFPGVDLRCMGPSLFDFGLTVYDREAPAKQHEYAAKVTRELDGFDIVHSHIEHVLLPFIPQIKPPVVSTVHGANFLKPEEELFRQYPDGTFIALSKKAVEILPFIHFSGVVYNGIDAAGVPFVAEPNQPEYLAWIGRYAQNKGALDAVRASLVAGQVLTLAGFEQAGQEEYFKLLNEYVDGAKIRMLDKMIGDIKFSFLGNARALLFPIHWDEPFGLVMIEAMACGTPVIAYNHGSVPEIIRDGVTGFIVEPPESENSADLASLSNTAFLPNGTIIKQRGVEGLVEAISRIGEIDRAACRKHVEENFTIARMVDGYEKVYRQQLSPR